MSDAHWPDDLPPVTGRTPEHLAAEARLLEAQQAVGRVEAELAETVRVREELTRLNDSIRRGPILCDDLRHLETRFAARIREVQELRGKRLRALDDANRRWRYANLTPEQQREVDGG